MIPHRKQKQCQYVTKQFAKKIATLQKLKLEALIGIISGDKDSYLSDSIYTATSWSLPLLVGSSESESSQYSKKRQSC